MFLHSVLAMLFLSFCSSFYPASEDPPFSPRFVMPDLTALDGSIWPPINHQSCSAFSSRLPIFPAC
jgi:hypothetical protein